MHGIMSILRNYGEFYIFHEIKNRFHRGDCVFKANVLWILWFHDSRQFFRTIITEFPEQVRARWIKTRANNAFVSFPSHLHTANNTLSRDESSFVRGLFEKMSAIVLYRYLAICSYICIFIFHPLDYPFVFHSWEVSFELNRFENVYCRPTPCVGECR